VILSTIHRGRLVGREELVDVTESYRSSSRIYVCPFRHEVWLQQISSDGGPRAWVVERPCPEVAGTFIGTIISPGFSFTDRWEWDGLPSPNSYSPQFVDSFWLLVLEFLLVSAPGWQQTRQHNSAVRLSNARALWRAQHPTENFPYDDYRRNPDAYALPLTGPAFALGE
jgi:hypothetical protein